MNIFSPEGWKIVTPPSSREPSAPGGIIRFLIRTLANVPRIITSWWPRREPYELKSALVTPCSFSQLPAGDDSLIDPAGEMWSVVIESPNSAIARAPWIAAGGGGGVISKCPKNGGWAMYVDSGQL